MNGHTGCRLCKPSGCTNKTGPIVLEANKDLDPKTGKVLHVEPIVIQVEDAYDDRTQSVTTLESNGLRNPLVKSQNEEKLLVWELKRPALNLPMQPLSIVPSTGQQPFSSEEIQAISQQQLIEINKLLVDVCDATELAELIQHIFQNKSPQHINNFYQALQVQIPKGNGSVTEHSPLFSKLVGCHNAAMMLGSSEQGKSILFYIANYISKSKVAFEQCFTVLEHAMDHVAKYPSTIMYKAKDDNEIAWRNTTHILQRTLNRLNLLMEISDYQAAAALIGLPTEIVSDRFTYMDPRAAIALCKLDLVSNEVESNLARAHDALIDEQEKAEDEFVAQDDDSFIDHEDDVTVDVPDPTPFYISAETMDSLGKAAFYSIDDGNGGEKKIAVPYPIHWRYRGKEL